MTHETLHQRQQRVSESVASFARRERWVLTTAELRHAGASESWILRRAQEGWLTQQFRGVWLVGRARATQDELERAALKACGEGAVLSHRSAGMRWRIVLRYRGPVEVTAPTHRRSRGRLRTYRRALHPRDVTMKDGVPMTTLARTLVDLAAVSDEQALLHAVHEADHLKRLSVPAVDASLSRAGTRPRGAPALRRCLRRHRPTTGTVNRSLERAFVQFLRRHGFPPTEHNVLVEIEAGEMVAFDVYFRAYGVVVELDGGAHETKERFHGDRRRDRRVQAAQGILTFRVTGEDLRDRARERELADDLWATLERRGLSRHETPHR